MYSFQKRIIDSFLPDNTKSFFSTFYTDLTTDFVLPNSKSTFEIKVPGYKKDEIDIYIDGDTLFVDCKSKKYGDITYKYYNASSSDVEATLEDGILTINVNQDKSKRKDVEVKQK